MPVGVHEATWAELVDQFGTTVRRRKLLGGLLLALQNLRGAGCVRAWIDGSFVTEKAVPGDFDICWDPEGVDPARLDPIILDARPPRFAQRVKYGGDILPNPSGPDITYSFVDFFQVDKFTGNAKGIVLMHLRSLPI